MKHGRTTIQCSMAFVLYALILSLPAVLSAEPEHTAPREWRQWFVPQEHIRNLSVEPTLPMNRQRFESLIQQLEQRSGMPRGEAWGAPHPHLSKIVLCGRLDGRQFVNGLGTFTLHPRSEGFGNLPLNPLTLAIHSLRWSDGFGHTDGPEAMLFHDSDFGNQLFVPSATDSNDFNQLQFQWSLQSRKDVRNNIVFDVALPPCMSIELRLELPIFLTLSSSSGLVLPADDSVDGYRTWQVLLGHHSHTTLTVSEDQTLLSEQPKSAIQQRIVYSVRPDGLTAQTYIVFDRLVPRPHELVFELEMPLRPVGVRYGDQPITSWTRSAVSPEITEVRIDLSAFTGEEPQELLVESLAPLLEDQRWLLPRVRATSPDIFWTATRCAVSIYSPLRVQNLNAHQAVQVAPRTEVDWAERELYVFQFFQDDAQIEIEVVYSVPPVMVNSAVQIILEDNEIRGTVYLENSVTEGERFTLNFPLSEHWTVDSVSVYAPSILPGEREPVFSWDLLETAQDYTALEQTSPSQSLQTLSVQLESPIRPRHPVILQFSCRFSNSSQNQFRLSDLSPFQLPHRRIEQQHIAIRTNLTAYTVRSSAPTHRSDGSSTLTFGNNTHIPMFGETYPLNSRTQNILFEKERTRANFTAEIAGTVYVGEAGLIPTFRIRCMPLDLPITRAIIHFTPFGEDDVPTQWDWSLVGAVEPVRPFRVNKVSERELMAMLTVSEQQNWSEDLLRGELWEIRFDELVSTPFELSAVSLIPLADSMRLPFAAMPFASSQRGELTILSPHHFDYRIVGGHHNSIPVAPPAWDRYQDVRAAFRYNPMDEIRRSLHSPLLIQKLKPEEQFDTAWVWSLRLDTQYDSEGIVRNRAIFLVENQGRGTMKIKLPTGIDASHLSSVWRDSQQIPWHYDTAAKEIAVALPVGQRFVSIALEYTHQDLPLVHQRKLRPRFPSADAPILSGSWISWFPPEFDVSLRRTSLADEGEMESRFVLSKALDYLLGRTYRSFLWTEWDNALHGKQRRVETDAAAQYFFNEIVEVLKSSAGTPNPVSTWGGLIGHEQLIPTVRYRLEEDTKRSVITRLLIDKQALTFLGIAPATPIENIALINQENVREKLFERAGLVLLIATRTRADGIREYVLALTAPTTLSLNRQFQATPSGHCVRMVPFEFFESVSYTSPDWLPASRWMLETTLSSIPWSVSAQVLQGTALTSDWNAYELPIDIEQTLYIVHRQKISAFQWLAFLAVVLITCRKPFSSPILLLVLLIVFELTARSVAPCYVGIPSGAMLGVLVSLAFVLIRSQVVPQEPTPPAPPRNDYSTEWSASFVPTPFNARPVLFCALLLGLASHAAAQTPPPHQAPARTEPFRVFYPIDANEQFVGNDVWVPLELSLLLQNARRDNSATAQRFHITRATYHGSLIRTAQGTLECSDDFKAVYEIVLDSPNATITLPNIPAVPGRSLWNAQTIQPVLHDEGPDSMLSFLIENETPGKHTLEIALAPKTTVKTEWRHAEPTYTIAFAIPKVPQTTFRLNVPADTPALHVPHALGAIFPNSHAEPVLIAELGPVGQLAFSWGENPNLTGTLLQEVEQFFWIRAMPSQIVLETLFRYRIDGGTIQQLTIRTDPRWSPSGQFRCNEHPILTSTELQSFDSLYNESIIEFHSPVSGTFTLRRDFVLRNFDGIGNLRLPVFTALHSRITRSMLGVSADPTLELQFPLIGHTAEFEAGWYGTPNTAIAPPLFGNNPFWEIAEEAFSRQRETSREKPKAAYDLTQIMPDWTLNIRAKKTTPDAAVTQSVLFEPHESKIYVLGEFTAQAPVFRQYFSTYPPIQIESIEVRNAQGNIVESRLQQIQPELPTHRERYIVFIKNHVVGQYTITVQGFFDADSLESAPAEGMQALPTLFFDNAERTEHTVNLFRTPAVIAEIPKEQTGWVKASSVPSAPEPFGQVNPLGSWKKNINENNINENNVLGFALAPNRPDVKSTTTLSLLNDHDEQWAMMIDFDAEINGGELDSLSFQWDERCGTIQSIEPNIATWTLTQTGPRQLLTLTMSEPKQEKLQFKMLVSLNTTVAAALPNVFPITQNIDSFESEILVELPIKKGDDIIPWDLTGLEKIEEKEDEGQTDDTGRALYKAADTHFGAVISQVESRLTALFYDIAFLVYRDGMMTGILTVDLRNRGQDSFILQMPTGYTPIQISSAGSVVDRTRLEGEGRLRINIGTSDYPQRLSILFRASLSRPLNRWSQEQIVSTLQFPALEGVMIQETIWTIAFEGNVPTLNVVAEMDQHWGAGTMLPPSLTGGAVYNLENHIPLSGRTATTTQIGVNLIREHNLLRVLDSIPGSVRQDEAQRWFMHWLDEWNTVADKVDFQVSNIPVTLQNVRANFILRPRPASAERTETTRNVRSFLETLSSSTREALRYTKEQSVSEKFGTMDIQPRKHVPILNSQVYWQGRISDDMRYLFGAEEGAIRAMTLTSLLPETPWTDWMTEHIWLWICLGIVSPIVVLLSVRWVYILELWLQFPHFWGMTIGVLLWIMLPESFIGLIIIILTFASSFRPSWLHRRVRR